MNKKLYILTIALLLPLASQARLGQKGGGMARSVDATTTSRSHAAHGHLHEILVNIGGSTPNGLVSESNLTFGSGTQITFGGGYNYALLNWLQIGGKVAVSNSSPAGAFGTSTTIFHMLAGATANIPLKPGGHWDDAFFAAAYLGFRAGSTAVGSSFVFVIEGGKRFLLLDNVSYKPGIQLYVPTNGSVTFSLQFLNASIHF